MLPTAPPLSLTPLIGRDDDVARVIGLLVETRLLTLVGAGGTGKTRLAAEVAAREAARFRDGIAWVELAPLTDDALLPTYVLNALDVEQGARAPGDALIDTLRDKELLLVLDNCEHLVDGCANLAQSLLLACPQLRILATSREALGIGGERAWLVPGLAIPAAESADMSSIEESAAVRLFVDRAQAAQASFRLTAANAGAIAQICRRVDGLPLAIELAAARIRALPPEELASRLHDAFKALGTGARTATPRHRTLRAAVDWSYALLEDPEQLLLQRLSVFAGDFSLEAAEAVGADAALDSADVLDTMSALVDKSLVVMREAEGTARFYLLETIRQFASAKLKEAGPATFHEVSARHARTFRLLVAASAPHFITRERPDFVRRVHRELDNVRVALAWTREHAVADHLQLAGDLGWFWYSSGLWGEGRGWCEGALSLPRPDAHADHARARVLLSAGVIASLQGQPTTSGPWLLEAEQLFLAAGDESGASYAQAYQGVTFGQVSDERAVAPTRRALAWFRAAGDLYGLRLCLIVLATFHANRGELQTARELGSEGVDVARAFGLDRELAIALQILATVTLSSGDYASTDALVRESLAALRRDPSLLWSARALQLLAIVNFHAGNTRRGAELMGSAEVARESIGAGLFGGDRRLLEPVLEQARNTLGIGEFDEAWKRGRTQRLDQVMEQELSVPHAAGKAADVVPAVTSEANDLLLDVTALGPVRILREGKPLSPDAWRYARPRELLLYLLAHADGRTREQIGLDFWPDASPTQVKNNFHVMLHHVRKTIGRADLVTFSRDRYRIAWELGVRFDARAFEEQVRAATRALKGARSEAEQEVALASLRDGLALYGGDFLAEEGALDWHLEMRDRLRRLYSEGLLLLGDRTLERGAHEEAADAFRRAIAVDELHEEAHRRLMVALARAGKRSEALRQYNRLTDLLHKELESEPEPQTRALFERLRHDSTPV